uniref:Uncharacterized protein n=1 Tax=Oryza meridionalis TaxID=40149 RepID=A0A0E0E964_9ORYZ
MASRRRMSAAPGMRAGKGSSQNAVRKKPVVPAVATPTSIKRADRRMSGGKEIALRSSSATCRNTRRGLQR